MIRPLAGKSFGAFSSNLGLQQHLFEQVVDALAGLGRDADEWRVATVFFRHDFLGDQFLLDALGLASGLSILVTATTIGTPAALAWWMASWSAA